VKVVAGVALSLLVVWLWPEPPIDMTKVHTKLRELQFPLRRVTIDSYLDGGSIGVRLEDAAGKVLMYAIPCDAAAGKHKELRVGAMYVGKVETQPVESPQETMRYLQRLADDNAPLNVNKVIALLDWRTAPRDCLRFVGWVLLNHFDGVGPRSSVSE
jgi:hypothetical protein